MTDKLTSIASKVAQVTLAFWIMKILATTLGETAGDFISMAAIIATTTAGTEVSDMMDRSFGLGYAAGSLILIAGLAATLAIWYWRDRDLSVYPIRRKDAETFYWIAIVFSNSLGTAFGDWLTDNAGLSYVQGALVTAAVIGVVVALHYGTRISHVLLFWIAFIFTRPFGATFGDLLTKPLDHGGFNLPRGTASLITLALLAGVLVVSEYLSRRNDSRNDPGTIERLEARAGE